MKKKHLYIEALRVLACLAVVLNHTSDSFYYLFTTREAGSLQYYVDLCISISCKFAVPLFFALSGALMLGREISMKKLWCSRIPKTALMLIVFSIASHLIGAAAGREYLGVKGMLFLGYDRDLNYSYWYLYAYIAFLMALPLLSAMLRTLGNREILYMIGLGLFFRCFLPAIEQLRWEGAHHLSEHMDISWLTADVVLYPTIGYYLHNRMDVKACKRALPLLWIAAAAGLYMSCQLTWQKYLQDWKMYSETYHALFGGVYAAAIFATVRVLYAGVSGESRLGKWTAALGGVTLGVYLVHVLIMDYTRLFQELVWIPMHALHLPEMVCGVIHGVLLFMVSAAVAVILKRIPGLKLLLK